VLLHDHEYTTSGREESKAEAIAPHWAGGDEQLALLEQLGDVRGVRITAPLTDTAVPYLNRLSQRQSTELCHTHISDAGVTE
jgi:hypothetical protein